MIASFGDKATESLYHGLQNTKTRQWSQEVIRKALNKLDMLNGAHELLDLRSPPGNRLEALQGEMIGLFSIRINDQWRIIFRWQDGNAHEVRLLDYHR